MVTIACSTRRACITIGYHASQHGADRRTCENVEDRRTAAFSIRVGRGGWEASTCSSHQQQAVPYPVDPESRLRRTHTIGRTPFRRDASKNSSREWCLSLGHPQDDNPKREHVSEHQGGRQHLDNRECMLPSILKALLRVCGNCEGRGGTLVQHNEKTA